MEGTKTLKLWAGFNLPLYLSLATFAIGFVFYSARRGFVAFFRRLFGFLPTMDVEWDKFMAGLKALAAWQTRLIQTGRLTDYLLVTFGTIAVSLIAVFVYRGIPTPNLEIGEANWLAYAVALLTLGGGFLAAITNSRITGVACLGVVGIGAALIFIMFSAPDVAITQLLVETLVVVLVAVVMLRLPSMPRHKFNGLNALVALSVGVTTTLVFLAVLNDPLDLRLSDYFAETSWPEAFGRNVVNVILVDFRAIDTFGEIAVVVIAALSAYALLRTTRPTSESEGENS